jgi:MRN-interacting protein
MEYLALQCASCSKFSNQLRTKDGKWTCKLCAKKQSIVKVYFKSFNPKDTRLAVASFNENKGRREDQIVSINGLVNRDGLGMDSVNQTVTIKTADYDASVDPDHQSSAVSEPEEVYGSMWSEFLDDTSESDPKRPRTS